MDIYNMAGHLIRRLNQISVALFTERMASVGLNLTPVQFAAICAIRDRPGVDQATVAGMIAYDRATLGKVIDRLEARGVVARKTSATDRRAKQLSLTEKGLELWETALPHARQVQPQILGGLNAAERDQMMLLLDKATMAGNELSRAPLKLAKDTRKDSDAD